MSRHASQPLQPWAWLGVPAVLCIAATILLGIPIQVFGLRLPEPLFPMVLAFGWAVVRPSVLGPLVLLLLGLFLDLFWGSPVGLWALCLLLAYGGAILARSLMVGQSTAVLAIWYLAFTGLAFLAAYLFVMLDAHVTPDLTAIVFQLVVTLALFPIAMKLIDRFEDADVRFR